MKVETVFQRKLQMQLLQLTNMFYCNAFSILLFPFQENLQNSPLRTWTSRSCHYWLCRFGFTLNFRFLTTKLSHDLDSQFIFPTLKAFGTEFHIQKVNIQQHWPELYPVQESLCRPCAVCQRTPVLTHSTARYPMSVSSFWAQKTGDTIRLDW